MNFLECYCQLAKADLKPFTWKVPFWERSRRDFHSFTTCFFNTIKLKMLHFSYVFFLVLTSFHPRRAEEETHIYPHGIVTVIIFESFCEILCCHNRRPVFRTGESNRVHFYRLNSIRYLQPCTSLYIYMDINKTNLYESWCLSFDTVNIVRFYTINDCIQW